MSISRSTSRPPPIHVAALAALAVVLAALASGSSGCRRYYTTGSEGDPVSCSNNIDDDGDFATDCNDPGCVAYCGGGSDAGDGSDGGGGGVCGNGILEGLEDCDGSNLNGESCFSLGFAGGSLMCTAGCFFNTVNCTGGGTCGDDTCGAGETCSTCPSDCGSCCGNGSCTGGETCSTCPSDCGTCGGSCGDFVCAGAETCSNCAVDCGSCCGNGSCAGGETCSTCPSDCGSCCGNGVCSGGETCSTCPTDCGPCGPICGDFFCDAAGGESCSTCPTDCGGCAGCVYSWDLGTLSGWTASSTCTTTGWRVDSFRPFSPSYSLWYGDPATRTYACGASTNSGTVTSPFITLNAGAPIASWQMWMATEGSASWDTMTLYVVYLGTPTAVWTSASDLATPGSTGGAWVLESVDLSAWSGLSIQLRWGFDTFDGGANGYEGPYIDDLVVDGSC